MQSCLRICKSGISKRWEGNTYDLKTIAHGGSGIVLVLDDLRVIKIPLGSPRSVQDIETERKAYSRLAKESSPYILKCVDYTDSRGIILEKLEGTVRQHLNKLQKGPNEHDVLKWALQAARGLAVLHLCGIVQADVGCHNMLLDSNADLKLCDFSGCSINGSLASISYEPWSQYPDHSIPDMQTDIFALGSAIYEISVGHPPYHDMPEYDIMMNFKKSNYPGDFPAEKDQRLWTVIKMCWKGDLKTIDAVVTHIECISSSPSKRSLTGITLVSTPCADRENRFSFRNTVKKTELDGTSDCNKGDTRGNETLHKLDFSRWWMKPDNVSF